MRTSNRTNALLLTCALLMSGCATSYQPVPAQITIPSPSPRLLQTLPDIGSFSASAQSDMQQWQNVLMP